MMLPQYADGSKKGGKTGKKAKKKLSLLQCCILLLVVVWLGGVGSYFYRRLEHENGPQAGGLVGEIPIMIMILNSYLTLVCSALQVLSCSARKARTAVRGSSIARRFLRESSGVFQFPGGQMTRSRILESMSRVITWNKLRSVSVR